MNSRLIISMVSTLVLTIFTRTVIDAQVLGTKGDYIWELGYVIQDQLPQDKFFEINFNTDPPSVRLLNRKLSMGRTNASYTNEMGELIAYSSGVHIADSTYQIMTNGDSVSFSNFYPFVNTSDLGGYDLTRINMFLPVIDGLLYYLQQVPVVKNASTLIWFNNLSCSEISFEGTGAGKVEKKNQVLLTGAFEAGSMNACRHANGRDWWILIQKDGSGDFYSYLLDDTGLDFKSEANFNVPKYLSYQGGFIFSSNGNKCVKLAGSYGALMFDFDRETGILSNMFDLKTSFLPLGYADVAFSRNSRFLYTFNNSFLLQYDLINPGSNAILASIDTIAKYDPILLPKARFLMGNLAPDGKIYINAGGKQSLSVINYPDRKGKKCDLGIDQFVLPSYNANGAMPNFPHYRLGPIDGSESDTLGIDNLVQAKFRVDNDSSFYNKREFIDLSFLEPTSWSWDFGDGSFSSDTSPVHWFPGNGSYEVCLTVSNANGSDTYCRVINIGPVSAKNLIEDYGLSLSPNPCQDYILLNVKENYPKALQMSISDIQGKLIESGRIFLNNGFTTIDVSGIPAGSYYMTLSDGEGGQEVLPFVKM